MASYFLLDKNHLPNLLRNASGVSNYRFLSFLVIFTVINFILIYFSVPKNEVLIRYIVDVRSFSYTTEDEGTYSIYTEGCKIPELPIYDKNVTKFMNRKFDFLPCPKKDTALLDTNGSHIWIIKENLKHHYNFSKLEIPNISNISISCYYRQFYRPESIINVKKTAIDHRLKFDKCIYFRDIVNVNPNYEFAEVSCSYNKTKVYTKLLASAPKKRMTPQSGSSSQYNVLVIGLDSVSRMNLRRAMPKTWEFLKSLKAVELLGYNKVGDNTFSNVVPLLMGLRHTALQAICVPYKNSSFDSCPLVWKLFKRAGYYTAFAEDSSKHGIFNYLVGGFQGFPTDYYFHPFNALAEIVGNNYNNIYKRKLCLQERFVYEVLLDYIEKLTKTLANDRMFGFFWSINLSHDRVNNPKAMDGDYQNLFRRLNESGYLEKTVIIFLSDHGMRYGEIAKTERGRLENRLPFAYVVVPPSFRANYSAAYNTLRQNSKRLTTPFDMHKTLLDLINLQNIENDAIAFRSKQNYTNKTGISLFLPIPGKRTCKMADIDDTWCTCHKSTQISVSGTEVKNASNDLLVYLNKLLSGHSQCATLKLSKILQAMEMRMSYSKDIRLVVIVQVEPSGGEFEATLQKVGTTWQPVGTVSRLNRYGDQSRCINWYELKLYCFCEGSDI